MLNDPPTFARAPPPRHKMMLVPFGVLSLARSTRTQLTQCGACPSSPLNGRLRSFAERTGRVRVKAQSACSACWRAERVQLIDSPDWGRADPQGSQIEAPDLTNVHSIGRSNSTKKRPNQQTKRANKKKVPSPATF